MTVKKFEKREISASNENRAIIELWESVRKKILGDDTKREKELNDGSVNMALDKVEETFKIIIADGGKKIILESFEVHLDSDAAGLLVKFETDLINLIIGLGHHSNIDADIVNKALLLQEPIALIKEILTRSLVETLAKNGGIDDKANKYFEVLKIFIIDLNRLPITKEKKSSLGDLNTLPSEMMVDLCNLMTKWSPCISEMINLVNTLNQTNNIIETNLIALTSIKLKVQYTLYYWLRRSNGDENKVCETNFIEPWCSTLLANLEKDILTIEKEIHPIKINKEVSLTETGLTLKEHVEKVQKMAKIIQKKGKVSSSCSARVILAKPRNKDKAKVTSLLETLIIYNEGKYVLGFCNIEGAYEEKLIISSDIFSTDEYIPKEELLTDVNVLSKIDDKIKEVNGIFPTRIQILYNALYELDTIISDIGKIKTLTSSVGSLPFLLRAIQADNLSQWVSDCLKLAADACADETTKKTVLATLGIHIDIKQFCNFSILGQEFFIKRTITNISEQFEKLNTPAMIERKIINRKILQRLQITSVKDASSRMILQEEAESNRARLSNTITLESDKISFTLNDNSQTFFKVLGVDQKKFVDTLSENLKSNPKLSESLTSEIIKLKFLPPKLQRLLSEGEKDCLNTAQSLLIKSSSSLRTEALNLKPALELPQDPIQCHNEFKKNTFLLSPESSQEYAQYIEADTALINMLGVASKKPEFAKTFCSITYNEQIPYTPKQSSVIKQTIELMEIPVRIWEKNSSGELILMEQFQPQNQSKESPEHLLYTDINGFASFRVLEINHSKTARNQKVANFLYNLMQEKYSKVLDDSQKIEILEHLCVTDMQIAERELTEAMEESFSSLPQAEEMEYGLHAKLSRDGFKAVVSFLETYSIDPGAILTEIDYNKLKIKINTTLNDYISHGLKNSLNSRKNLLKNPSDDLTLEWEEKSYIIQINENQINQLEMFKEDLFYDCSTTNPLVFNKTTIPGDGHCGFNALGTTRDKLITCLEKAIEDEDNRKILALEIWNFIKFPEPSMPKINFYTDELKNGIEIYFELDDNLRTVRDTIRGKSEKNITLPDSHKDCLEYLKNRKDPALIEEQRLYEEYFEWENKLLAICASKEICEPYIKIYDNLNSQWLGEFSAKLYAKANGLNVRIYLRGKKHFNLVLHEECSYINEKNNETLNIFFLNANHYDRLNLDVNETKLFPNLWKNYGEYIYKNIASFLPVFQQDKQSDVSVASIKSCLVEASGLPQQKTAHFQNLKQKKEKEESINCGKKVRAKKEVEFDRTTIKYIEDELKDDISSLGWLVNAPLNEKNETLLLLAVKQKNADIVDSLLKLGASVATISESDCLVEIGRVDKPKPNSYVLQKAEGNIWELHYYDYKGAKTRFTRKTHIENLSLALKNYEMSNTEQTRNELAQTLKNYHQTVNPTTPLVSAAMDYGYNKDNKKDGRIFCSLMYAGLEEAKSRVDEVAQYSILKNLSNERLTQLLIAHYKKYIGVQQAEIDKDSLSADLYRLLVKKMNLDETDKRSVQHAQLVISLIQGEISHDYLKIIREGRIIDKEPEETSRLLGPARVIFEDSEKHIVTNNDLYQKQFTDYTSRPVENLNSQVAKLEEQRKRDQAEANERSNATKKELEETTKKLEALEKKVNEREAEGERKNPEDEITKRKLEELEKKISESETERERKKTEKKDAKKAEKDRKRPEKEQKKADNKLYRDAFFQMMREKEQEKQKEQKKQNIEQEETNNQGPV